MVIETTNIKAILFDLDGVLTDTAEAHFRAWKRLADEEGIPFTRQDNERLRGVSRRESLNRMLNGRSIDEETAQAWMERKNNYYRQLLKDFTKKDILPGVSELLAEIKGTQLKTAVVSASGNAPAVIEKLGLDEYFDASVTGADPARPKPRPDIFLLAAHRLELPPATCIVVEDATSGIDGAQAAGMVSVGLGPAERVGHADLVLPDLSDAHVADLLRAATWRVAEEQFEPDDQHHRETVFTLGTGSLGTRGTLEEGYPGDKQATLVHHLWDDAPLVYTELANAPDWTALDVWVDGHQFGMDEGTIDDYVRYLDLRTGELHRRLRWTPTGGAPVDLSFTRIACLDERPFLAVRISVTPVKEPVQVRISAKLDGHVENEGLLHWNAQEQGFRDGVAFLSVETRSTGKRLCEAMSLDQDFADSGPKYVDCPLEPGLEVEANLEADKTWTVDKIASLVRDGEKERLPMVAVSRVLEGLESGFEEIRKRNAASWKNFWDGSDVVIEGDDETQVAIRHALFQLRIAAPNADEYASIGARSLSGFGYKGHVFWDTEIFMLPFFTYTQPDLARNLLMYRWHTLSGARRNAQRDEYAGARYPWESAESGDEVTPPYLPDPNSKDLVRIWSGDLELHVTCDVAYAIWQYWQVSGDAEFMRQYGAPIILETACFWESCVEDDASHADQYVLTDVVGPDEYHEHVDNNVFTNRMVAWHLRTAQAVYKWLENIDPTKAEEVAKNIHLSPRRLRRWQEIADGLVILVDEQTGLYEQFEGFFDLAEVDWQKYADRTKPIQEVLGIEETNRRQALKQPDVLLLLCLLREDVRRREWRSNWDYYARRTDHAYGSSLGPAIHAWAASELGMPAEAYAHFMRAARADLQDIRGNAGDGIHAASAGALWQAIVFGFAGLQLQDGDGYTTTPRLPDNWDRVAFSFVHHGKRCTVDLSREPEEV